MEKIAFSLLSVAMLIAIAFAIPAVLAQSSLGLAATLDVRQTM